TVKTCIVNDRGIHICKSMIAWQKFANGDTPESTGMKGDHFVGLYYVKFNEQLKEETKPILASIYEKNDLQMFSPEEQEKLRALLAKSHELEMALKQSVLKIDIPSIPHLLLEPAVAEQAPVQVNWKSILKLAEESGTDARSDSTQNEKNLKHLQKLLKP